jgi:hypothetical protein
MKKVDNTSIPTQPTTEMVEAMHTHRQISASCSELTPAQCQSLAPELLAQWTSVELEALSDEAVDSLSAEQVAALCTAGIEGLSQDGSSTALKKAGPQSRGAQVVPHEELSHWQAREWEALTPAEFAQLTPTQVASLNGADLQALSDEVIDSLSVEQVMALSTAGIRGLSNRQLDALSENATVCPEQALPEDDKAKLSTVQMAAIGTVALVALGSACLAAWRVAEVPSFNSAQLSAPINTAVGTAMPTWGAMATANGQRTPLNAQAGHWQANQPPLLPLQPARSQHWALVSKTGNGTPARATW